MPFDQILITLRGPEAPFILTTKVPSVLGFTIQDMGFDEEDCLWTAEGDEDLVKRHYFPEILRQETIPWRLWTVLGAIGPMFPANRDLFESFDSLINTFHRLENHLMAMARDIMNEALNAMKTCVTLQTCLALLKQQFARAHAFIGEMAERVALLRLMWLVVNRAGIVIVMEILLSLLGKPAG